MMPMKPEVYWIEGPWPGRLAIMPRPRGGEWLEDEIAAWKTMGIDMAVSLLTDEEIRELDLTTEPRLCRSQGIAYLTFPLADRGVPPSHRKTLEFAQSLERVLLGGKNVALHCRAGIGRSAIIAACLLVLSGMDPESALRRIGTARGCCVPDTEEQREWVTRFATTLHKGRVPPLLPT